jgi:hypothetical protein
MKKIEFKELSQELIEQGITLELINKVIESKKFSPAILEEYGEPVELCRTGDDSYWVMLPDGNFLKDARNQLVKYELKNCIIARARYWLLYSDKEIAMDNQRREEQKQREIYTEVERIKEDLRDKVKKYNDDFNSIMLYAEKKDMSGLEGILIDAAKQNNPEKFIALKEAALKTIESNPNMQDFVNSINEQLEKEDFDSLYMSFETQGLPQLLSVKLDDKNGMELMKKFFSKDAIDSTIDAIQGRSHIETIATFNVNKKYV